MSNKTSIDINIALPQSAKDFLEYCTVVRNRSEGTVLGYEGDLKMFFNFITTYKNKKKININFIKGITLKDLYAFLSFLAQKVKDKDGNEKSKNSESTRARKVACLKSYFNYLQNKAKIITYNPAYELESPSLPERVPVYLNLNQSEHLLDSLNKSNRNFERDFCILTLFLNCGMRLSELCNIKINNIKEDTLTIIGKGDVERTVYLNESCLEAIDMYLKKRKGDLASEEEKRYLFLSEQNQRINKGTVEKLVKKHIKNANLVDKNYTCHKLRHSCATILYKEANVDLNTLKDILGHKNISTTTIYAHVDNESLRNAIKSNPLNKPKKKD